MAGGGFQQVQKYERGANRISASKLTQIADHLDTIEAAFFPTRDPTQVSEMPTTAMPRFGKLARLYDPMPARRQSLLIKLAQELAPDEA